RAFADDIIGIAKNSSEAEELLCDLCDSLKLGGLLVHETKCFSIGSHEITIGNTALVRADPSTHQYLGIFIDTGLPMRSSTEIRVSNITEEIERVMKLPLKGLQLLQAFN
ncbi:hypothetical protein ADUPG1_004186, partial [Aduncisulcus paluster]